VNSESTAAWAPPYSVVQSVTAPDRQMVVVPATSTSATTAMAKVSFTVLPHMEKGDTDVSVGWAMR
jgi:hypothetical protein